MINKKIGNILLLTFILIGLVFPVNALDRIRNPTSRYIQESQNARLISGIELFFKNLFSISIGNQILNPGQSTLIGNDLIASEYCSDAQLEDYIGDANGNKVGSAIIVKKQVINSGQTIQGTISFQIPVSTTSFGSWQVQNGIWCPSKNKFVDQSYDTITFTVQPLSSTCTTSTSASYCGSPKQIYVNDVICYNNNPTTNPRLIQTCADNEICQAGQCNVCQPITQGCPDSSTIIIKQCNNGVLQDTGNTCTNLPPPNPPIKNPNQTNIKQASLTEKEFSEGTDDLILSAACTKTEQCEKRENYTVSCIRTRAIQEINQKAQNSKCPGIFSGGGIAGGLICDVIGKIIVGETNLQKKVPDGTCRAVQSGNFFTQIAFSLGGFDVAWWMVIAAALLFILLISSRKS